MSEDHTDQRTGSRDAVRERLDAASEAILAARKIVTKGIKSRMSKRKAEEVQLDLIAHLATAQSFVDELLAAVRPSGANLSVVPDMGGDEDLGTDTDLPPIEDGKCTICDKLPCRHYPEEEDKRTEPNLSPQCPRCGSYEVELIEERIGGQDIAVWHCKRCTQTFAGEEA